MSLEQSLFWGLLLHFVGDYLLQSHYMAVHKTKRFFPAFAHATVYSIPFLAVCYSIWWTAIYISHYLIDRYRLAVYWVRIKNASWKGKLILPGPENNGFDEQTPAWLSTWLLIIVDNTIHIVINSVCIFLAYD